MSPTDPKFLQQAIDASSAGDSEAALRLLKSAIEAAPDHPLSHFLLAAEFAHAGRMQEAEAEYANTVLLAPAFEIARFQLGLLQFTSGRPSVAMLTWHPLLELPDTNPLQRFVRAFGALMSDSVQEASIHLREGIRLNRDNAALNGDMQKVLDRLAPLTQGPHQASGEHGEKEDISQEFHHVLLSNYRQDGPAH